MGFESSEYRPRFTDGHVQTLYAWARRRRFPRLRPPVARYFDVAADARVLAHCHWHEQPSAHPALVLLHGLEGSSLSHYMRGIADKAWAAGWNVVRLNQRNCGNTEHLSRGLYHSGLTHDPLFVMRELIDRDSITIQGQTVSPDSILGSHLVALSGRPRDAETRIQDSERSTLVDVLVSQAKGSHDIGWYVVDILLKLGLIGTIVGFILMLGSVADTASLDVNTMQKVLKQMSAGMGTALFTTLAGLTGSILLGLQYLLLDKGADLLIERILRLSESRLLLP